MGQSAPNNSTNLGQQQAQFNNELQLQQQQWASQQAAQAQANAANNQQLQQQTDQQNVQNTAQAQQFAANNAAQGAAQNAVGGASGQKGANTVLQGTLGLTPAQLKLQAAQQAGSPTSLQALAALRSGAGSAAGQSSNTLTSSPVRLGG